VEFVLMVDAKEMQPRRLVDAWFSPACGMSSGMPGVDRSGLCWLI